MPFPRETLRGRMLGKLTVLQKYVYTYVMANASNQKHRDEINLPCLCALIRKAGRVVTQQYDGHLKTGGLRVTQYSLLMNIRLNPEVAVSHLSKLMRMDQTTVTRNIKVLEKLNTISITQDQDDQRIRKISITSQGMAILKKARPSWEDAQRRVFQKLGKGKTQALIDALRCLTEP